MSLLLKARVQRQSWARALLTQRFGNNYDAEPIGYKDALGNVYVHPRLDAVAGHWHRGVDFDVPLLTTITDALGGRVVYAGWDDTGYGNMVAIEGRRYLARYAHLTRATVDIGRYIEAGYPLGKSGSTGNSTGPHLHFEIYDKQIGAYVDPLA